MCAHNLVRFCVEFYSCCASASSKHPPAHAKLMSLMLTMFSYIHIQFSMRLLAFLPQIFSMKKTVFLLFINKTCNNNNNNIFLFRCAVEPKYSWCEMRGATGAALLLILYCSWPPHMVTHICIENICQTFVYLLLHISKYTNKRLGFRRSYMKLQSAYYFWSGSIFLRARARARKCFFYSLNIICVCTYNHNGSIRECT